MSACYLLIASHLSCSYRRVQVLLQLALVHGVVTGVQHELLLLLEHVVYLVVPQLAVHCHLYLLFSGLQLPS